MITESGIHENTSAFILGIADVIRAALVINQLRRYDDMEMVFIWSGQHYSDNLKSIFFRELDIAPAEIDLGCGGKTDAEVVASVISKLYPVLKKMHPDAAVFLGDTNTTTGAIAAAQLTSRWSTSRAACGLTTGGCRRRNTARRSIISPTSSIHTSTNTRTRAFAKAEPRQHRRRWKPDRESSTIMTNLKCAKYRAMASPEFFRSRGIEEERLLSHDLSPAGERPHRELASRRY